MLLYLVISTNEVGAKPRHVEGYQSFYHRRQSFDEHCVIAPEEKWAL